MEKNAGPVTNARFMKAVNQSGSLFFAVFMVLALLVDVVLGFFDGTNPAWIFVLASAVTVIAYAHNQGFVTVDRSPRTMLGVYHVVFALAAIFIMPFGSTYFFIGLQLIQLSSYAYGRYGALSSSLVLGSVLIIDFITLEDVTSQDFALLVRILSVFAVLAAMIYFSVHVSRREIQELGAASRSLKTEHQRMLSLINSMGDAVVSTDANGNILSYNGAALDILDTNVTMNNKPLNDFVRLTDPKGEIVDIIAFATKRNRNVQRRDLLHTYDDGEKINLYVNITPVKIGYGDESQNGFTIILRDITKEKSLEEERDEFISVVSHELRTPITVTEGKISNAMLRNTNEVKNKKIGKSLDEAHQQVVFLADMINDLSTLARAERGALDVVPEKIDPKKLVQQLHDTYEIEAKQRGLELKVKTGTRVPSLVTSELYLKEVLQNFITNSIKYTQKGSVTIGVKAGGKGKVSFYVKDTGIGISKSDQKKLFDKFFRSEDYRTRESSGTGLGLYVTAKLAKKIKAEISVQSSLNKGSTFTIAVSSLKLRRSHRHSSSSV